MAHGQKRLREMASDLMEECGPYARMAALFLATESREDGDGKAELLWIRVAKIIVEMEAKPSSAARILQ